MASADTDRNSENHKRYRRFVYTTAMSLVHEVGHIFITYLTGGESGTPPSEPGGGGLIHGEGGRDLEQILFGGVHTCMRNVNDNMGDDQVCSYMCSSTERTACELTDALVWRPSPVEPVPTYACDPARRYR